LKFETAITVFIFRWVRKIAEGDYQIVMSVGLSVAWNNSALTRRIFMKFDIWEFFKHLARNFRLFQVGQEWRVVYMETDIQ